MRETKPKGWARVGVGVLLGASAAWAAAQPARASEPNTMTENAGSSAGEPAKLTAGELVPTLHRINEMEIEAGKMAEDQGSSKAVKDYGKTLRRDHMASDKQLERVARDSHLDVDGTIPGPVATDLQRAKSVMDALHGVKKAEFDRRFARAMADDHQKAIGIVSASLPDISDAKLKSLLEQLLPTLRSHEQAAEKILKETHTVSSNDTMPPSGASH